MAPLRADSGQLIASRTVKIGIIGGGPGGLYFAILMKKANAANEVDLYERNAPDDTFGWGVVFSDETLYHLEDADKETYDEISSTAARS